MKAKKENKIYDITTEQEKQRYLKEGYDVYDNNGKLLEYSPLKKIAYSEYDKIMAENAALKAENEDLKAHVAELEIAAQAAENPEKGVSRKKGGE